MSVSTRSLVATLREILGPGDLQDDAAALQATAIDGVTPRWLARPTSVESVAAVLALARDEGLAVVPRGSGSALELGGSPSRVDLVLDLAGLNAVLDYNADDLTVTVQAGMSLGQLNVTVLGARRQWLPLDPPGWASRTLGGLAATNASGPLRLRYGTLRDLLLGVRFVQADGVVTWGGARVVKSVTGYDIPKLMVGALGTLGVLVELTLRLHPRPDVEGTWLVSFSSLERLQAGLAAVLASTLQPSRLEFLDQAALRALGLGGGPLALAVSFGSVPEAVREQGAQLSELTGGAGGRASAVDEEVWAALDRGGLPAPGGIALQVASLPGGLAETVTAIERSAEALSGQASVVVTGSAALGLFRVLVTGGDVPSAAAMIEALRRALSEMGGHVIIQRGPASLRQRVDPWGPLDPAVLALMRETKATFDPTGVLNPGRFVARL